MFLDQVTNFSNLYPHAKWIIRITFLQTSLFKIETLLIEHVEPRQINALVSQLKPKVSESEVYVLIERK